MSAATEAASDRFQGLDQWKTTDILEALWAGQSRAVAACLPALPAVGQAVEDAAARLGSTGRLIYVGAGSSGLIAALDALELASTFDWPEERLAIVLGDVAGHGVRHAAGRLRGGVAVLAPGRRGARRRRPRLRGPGAVG